MLTRTFVKAVLSAATLSTSSSEREACIIGGLTLSHLQHGGFDADRAKAAATMLLRMQGRDPKASDSVTSGELAAVYSRFNSIMKTEMASEARGD
jgi:hypothetical protein